MNAFKASNNKQMLERAMSNAIVAWVEKSNPQLTKDEIVTRAMELLDAWEVKNSDLQENGDDWKYYLDVGRPGIVIGPRGEQINFILKETKKEIGHEFEFHITEKKRSDLYWVMDGYFIVRDYNAGCL